MGGLYKDSPNSGSAKGAIHTSLGQRPRNCPAHGHGLKARAIERAQLAAKKGKDRRFVQRQGLTDLPSLDNARQRRGLRLSSTAFGLAI